MCLCLLAFVLSCDCLVLCGRVLLELCLFVFEWLCLLLRACVQLFVAVLA